MTDSWRRTSPSRWVLPLDAVHTLVLDASDEDGFNVFLSTPYSYERGFEANFLGTYDSFREAILETTKMAIGFLTDRTFTNILRAERHAAYTKLYLELSMGIIDAEKL